MQSDSKHDLNNKPINSEDEDTQLFRWLQQNHDFIENPFLSTNTENDTFIHRHYLKLPIFDRCLKLKNSLIIGATGSGKSALAWALLQHFDATFSSRHVLTVLHVIKEITENPQCNDSALSIYTQQILETTICLTYIRLAQYGNELPNLKTQPKFAAALAGWFDEYLDYKDWRNDLAQCIKAESLRQAFVSQNVSFVKDAPPVARGTANKTWLTYWLALLADSSEQADARYDLNKIPNDPWTRFTAFINLLLEIGIREIILLVDGFDPRNEQSSVEVIVETMTPALILLKESHRLPHLYYKLFVPDDVGRPEQASERLQIASDVEILTFKWGRKALAQLLRSRLSFASEGAVKSLNQLCESQSKYDYDDILLNGGYKGHRRPTNARELLDFARLFVLKHVIKDKKHTNKSNELSEQKQTPVSKIESIDPTTRRLASYPSKQPQKLKPKEESILTSNIVAIKKKRNNGNNSMQKPSHYVAAIQKIDSPIR